MQNVKKGKMGKIFTARGFTGTVAEMATYFGINERTLRTRLRRGNSIEQAVTTEVDKKKSVHIPNAYDIGKYRGFPDDISNRFGVKFNHNERVSQENTLAKIIKYNPPEFYQVGDYCGTLIAISEDFDCPLSVLKKGLKDGRTPAEVIEEGGYSLC